MLSDYIKISNFFPRYAHKVANFARKVHGKNSRGNACKLSEEEKKIVASGLDKMVSDIKKSLL